LYLPVTAANMQIPRISRPFPSAYGLCVDSGKLEIIAHCDGRTELMGALPSRFPPKKNHIPPQLAPNFTPPWLTRPSQINTTVAPQPAVRR